jgi:hypothetical protein
MWALNGEDVYKISNKIQVFCYMMPCKNLEPNCHSCQAEFCINNILTSYSKVSHSVRTRVTGIQKGRLETNLDRQP